MGANADRNVGADAAAAGATGAAAAGATTSDEAEERRFVPHEGARRAQEGLIVSRSRLIFAVPDFAVLVTRLCPSPSMLL